MAENGPPVRWHDRVEIASGGGYQGPWRMNESVYRYVDDPTVAMNSSGTLGLAWVDQAEKDVFFQRVTFDGEAQLAEPVNVSRSPIAGDETSPARGPSLAVDAAGDIYLVWTVGEDPDANIHLAGSTDRGRSFGPARVAVETTGHADAPNIAVDSDGTLHLVFAHSPLGPFQHYHIAYSRSVDGGHSFQDPKTISHPQTEGVESVSFPALALDGADNLYVLWELFPTLGGRPRGLGFTYSDDRGQSFAAPSVVPGSRGPALGANGSLQGLLMQKLTVNPAGAIAVVNSTFQANESSHVWLFPARSDLE